MSSTKGEGSAAFGGRAGCRHEGERFAAHIRRRLQSPDPTAADHAFFRTANALLGRRRRMPALLAMAVSTRDPQRVWVPRLSLGDLRDRFARIEGEDQPPLTPGMLALARMEAEVRLAREEVGAVGLLLQPAVGIWSDRKAFGPLGRHEIRAFDGVVVDVDLPVPPGETVADYAAVTPRLLVRELVAHGLPEPTVMLATGGGYHLAWLFTRRLPSLGRPGARVHPSDRIAAFQRRVVEVLRPFGADPRGGGPTRALHLPCSFNPKRGCWVHVVHNGPPVDPHLVEDMGMSRIRAEGRRRRIAPVEVDRPNGGVPDWDAHPLFDLLRRGRIRAGSRNAALVLAASAAVLAGATPRERAAFVRHLAERCCEDGPQEWRSVLKTVEKRASMRRPYGISPRIARDIWVELDGMRVDLALLVQDFLRRHAAATRPRRRSDRKHPGRCMPVVDVLVHLMRLCREILDNPPKGFDVAGSHIQAPARLWAARLGVSVRTLEHLRASLERAFAEAGKAMPPIFVARRGRGGGLAVDVAALASARFWLHGAPALRRLARGSLAVLRTLHGMEAMIARARQVVDQGRPPEEVLAEIAAAAGRPRTPPLRAPAKSTTSKDAMHRPRGSAAIRRIPRREVLDVRERRRHHPFLIPDPVPATVPIRTWPAADPPALRLYRRRPGRCPHPSARMQPTPSSPPHATSALIRRDQRHSIRAASSRCHDLDTS